MQIFRDAIFTLFGLSLFINAVLFIPQAIKVYRTKESHDFSKFMFIGFCLMQLIAIVYGYIKSDWILVFGYLISFISCGTVTILIFVYSKK